MQEILSRTLIFKAFVLAPVTNKEIAKIDTGFLAYGAQDISWKNGFSYYGYNKWSGSGPYLLVMLADYGHSHFQLGFCLCWPQLPG